MIHLKNILLVSFFLIGLNSFAQKDSIKYGRLEVKVVDEKTKKPIEYSLVILEKAGFKKSKYSDKNGEVIFESLPIGNYNIVIVYPGYSKTILEGVILKANTITNRTIVLHSKNCFQVKNIERKPIIKPDEPTHQNLNKKQIMKMPY